MSFTSLFDREIWRPVRFPTKSLRKPRILHSQKLNSAIFQVSRNHKQGLCLAFCVPTVEFSKNFQAFLENYGKEKNIFECAFTLYETFHWLFLCVISSFWGIFRKLSRVRSSNCARNSPCSTSNQIRLRGQLPRCDKFNAFFRVS